MEAFSKYAREKRHCVGERKESHGMVEIKLLCFRRLSPFFKHLQKLFPGFAEGQAIFSVHLIWIHFQFNGFPVDSVHVSGFLQKDVLYPVV